MFFGSKYAGVHTIHVKLAILSTLMIVAGFLLLFSFTYIFLDSTLQRETRNDLRFRLLENWAAYKTGGIDFIEDELEMQKRFAGGTPFFLRVANLSNRTLFSVFPRDWEVLNLDTMDPELLLKDGKPVLIRSEEGDLSVMVQGIPLGDGNYLQVGMSTEENRNLLRHFSRVLLFTLAPLVLISILAGLLITSKLLHPIQELIDTVRSVRKTGDMRVRVPVRATGDELDTLSRLFNEMLERIELLISGMRETLDNVAHDLRTPLTRISLSTGVVLEGEEDGAAYRGAMEQVYEQTQKLQAMLDSILDIRGAGTGVIKLDREMVDLSGLVEDVTELYQYVTEEKGIHIHTDLPPRILCLLDKNRIRQVVANLLDNAVKYTPPRGHVWISLVNTDDHVEVTIRDTGSGIPEDEIKSIWERLYRGSRQQDQPGLGLGLSMVRAIVEAHGGVVDVKSRVGEGSEFSVLFYRGEGE